MPDTLMAELASVLLVPAAGGMTAMLTESMVVSDWSANDCRGNSPTRAAIAKAATIGNAQKAFSARLNF